VSYQENLMLIKLVIEDPSSLSLSRVRLILISDLGI
jgi:hypothetical protein